MKRYESSVCTFAVPDDWVTEPPFAFREPGEKGSRLGAQILERCLPEMPAVAPYSRDQKLILAELYEGFELLQEGAHHMGGAGEGYTLTFRFLDEDDNPSIGRMLYFTCGPLVCQLFLSGPDERNPETDRLFEAIGKTFVFRSAESLVGSKTGSLTSETLRLSQAEAAKGWTGPWSKFPLCCVSLPTRVGWEVVTDERDDVFFLRGNTEIRLHREIGEHAEIDIWFTNRIKRLQEEHDRLIGAEQAEIGRGPYAAIVYEEKGAVRIWKTAAVKRCYEIFLMEQQPLIWTLRTQELGFSDSQQVFESLISAACFLDPAEWETRLAEPWLDYTLRGPWQAEGAGIYASIQEAPTIILLSAEPTTFSLEKLEVSILESMRRGFRLHAGFTEQSVMGAWRQHDVFYYSLDGREAESNEPISIRSAWLIRDRWLYTIFVRGVAASPVESLSRSLLEAFKVSR